MFYEDVLDEKKSQPGSNAMSECKVVSLPYCMSDKCGILIKQLKNRYYVDALGSFWGTVEQCQMAQKPLPDNPQGKPTSMIGPWCADCIFELINHMERQFEKPTVDNQ